MKPLVLSALVLAAASFTLTPDLLRAQGSPDAGAAVGQEAGRFNGTIVDLDVAGQQITVTGPKQDGASKNFLITPQTKLIGQDGKPIKMLELRANDQVSVLPGTGNTAAEVKVIGDGYEIP